MYNEDIDGSIAHVRCWVSRASSRSMRPKRSLRVLRAILKDIEDGKVEFSLDYEDIHMNVEQLLTERIGDTGKRLHTGRSRNDQVALDMRLYVKKEIKEIIKLILGS